MNVKTLRLVDKRATSNGQVDDLLLTDFPNSFEDVPSLLWNLGDILH